MTENKHSKDSLPLTLRGNTDHDPHPYDHSSPSQVMGEGSTVHVLGGASQQFMIWGEGWSNSSWSGGSVGQNFMVHGVLAGQQFMVQGRGGSTVNGLGGEVDQQFMVWGRGGITVHGSRWIDLPLYPPPPEQNHTQE